MRFLLLLFTSIVFAQQIPTVDFKTGHASIAINPVKRNVVGSCEYTFEVSSNKLDTIRIDAQKMEFTNVKVNGFVVKCFATKKELLIYKGFHKGSNTVSFDYEAFPTQGMYFVNWDFTKPDLKPEDINGQVWTQGQGKYTSNWLPSFDDPNEKVVFSLDIAFEKSFQVISNGVFKKVAPVNDEMLNWTYEMKQPMSSYLLMVAIGHFKKQEDRSASGIPIEMYYEREDSTKLETTYRYSTRVFDFLENEIGVPYPWEIYRHVPVRDFLYAGMENTSATIFSRDLVVDAIGYNDRNYLNVNAHELAHQWFGDLVTAKTGKDHWLQEGFATFYALLAEREIFGDNHFYNKLYQSAMQLKQASMSDSIPLLNAKASSLTFYQKGAWALFVLHEGMGREKFNLAVKNYLLKYAFQNVTTADFLTEVNLVSDFDTNVFRRKWLDGTVFPEEDVLELMRKNEFMAQYITLQKSPPDLSKDKTQILEIMNADGYYPIKELLVYQNIAAPFEDKSYLLDAALKTGNVQVRQAVAATLNEIPEDFRKQYEGLLNDLSYETREMALFNLWKEFPDQRDRYLEVSKNWIGFNDKNLRLLHLSLAFASETDDKKKLKAYLELLSYTGTNYDATLQQAALEKLLNLEVYRTEVFKSLVYGTGSHRWQFVKFSKDNIRKLIKEPKYREMFVKIRLDLPIREKTQLQRLLEE